MPHPILWVKEFPNPGSSPVYTTVYSPAPGLYLGIDQAGNKVFASTGGSWAADTMATPAQFFVGGASGLGLGYANGAAWGWSNDRADVVLGGNNGDLQPFARWNGSAWAQASVLIRIPAGVNPKAVEVSAITGTGPNDIWAGGAYRWFNGTSDVWASCVLHSRDNGQTWDFRTLRTSSSQAQVLGMFAISPYLIYAVDFDDDVGGPNTFYRFDGRDWTSVVLDNGNNTQNVTDVWASSEDDIWVAMDVFDGVHPSFLYHSIDKGQTFSQVHPTPGWAVGDDALYFYNPTGVTEADIWTSTSAGPVLRSIDGGATWENTSLPATPTAIYAGADKVLVAAGNDIWSYTRPSFKIPASGSLQVKMFVNDDGPVSSAGARLRLFLQHPHIEDLTFTLTGPNSARGQASKSWTGADLGGGSLIATDERRVYDADAAGKTTLGSWTLTIANAGTKKGYLKRAALLVEGAGPDGLGMDIYDWGVFVDPTKVNHGSGSAADYEAAVQAVESLMQSHTEGGVIRGSTTITPGTPDAYPDDDNSIPDEIIPD